MLLDNTFHRSSPLEPQRAAHLDWTVTYSIVSMPGTASSIPSAVMMASAANVHTTVCSG